MKRTKRIVMWFLLMFTLAGALSYFPTRSRSVDIKSGFKYGEPSNQIEANGDGKFVRTWRGFPATIHETETVKYPGGNYYESTVYEIQQFSLARLVMNLIYWVGLMVALLAPVTIFYRPKPRPRSVDEDQTGKAQGPQNSGVATGVKPTEAETQSRAEPANAHSRH